ncbi:MAG: hypothetical protein GXP29_13680, partial [Planctomycetes bacterium]|nr:hypothetical protein [Planctomycetota bacterium]
MVTARPTPAPAIWTPPRLSIIVGACVGLWAWRTRVYGGVTIVLAAAKEMLSLKDIVSAYWPVLLVSFGISLLATPLCRAIARRLKVVDRPDDWLKPHKQPIPYLGGVAIYLAWAGGILFGIWWMARLDVWKTAAPLPFSDPVMLGILIGGTAIMALGLFDD